MRPASLPVHKVASVQDTLYRRESSLFFEENSLLCLGKFPVPLRREFRCKLLNSLND